MESLGPVTKKDLEDIFCSKDFNRLFRQSARYTFNNGRESGFFVARDFRDRLLYSDVIKGGTESLDGRDIEDSTQSLEKRSGVESGESYQVFNFHFHPDIAGCVCPSGPEDEMDDYRDIGHFNLLREQPGHVLYEVSCKPVCGVAKIDTDKNINMLLLQEKPDKPLTDSLLVESYSMINELKGRGYPSTREVAEEFRKTGLYKATNIEFRLTSKGVLIPDSELDKLGDFAYQPSLKYASFEDTNIYSGLK